jgi:hypothetical protein
MRTGYNTKSLPVGAKLSYVVMTSFELKIKNDLSTPTFFLNVRLLIIVFESKSGTDTIVFCIFFRFNLYVLGNLSSIKSLSSASSFFVLVLTLIEISLIFLYNQKKHKILLMNIGTLGLSLFIEPAKSRKR